jgi:hypothetical protein
VVGISGATNTLLVVGLITVDIDDHDGCRDKCG